MCEVKVGREGGRGRGWGGWSVGRERATGRPPPGVVVARAGGEARRPYQAARPARTRPLTPEGLPCPRADRRTTAFWRGSGGRQGGRGASGAARRTGARQRIHRPFSDSRERSSVRRTLKAGPRGREPGQLGRGEGSAALRPVDPHDRQHVGASASRPPSPPSLRAVSLAQRASQSRQVHGSRPTPPSFRAARGGGRGPHSAERPSPAAPAGDHS